jgi:hypothetical protein
MDGAAAFSSLPPINDSNSLDFRNDIDNGNGNGNNK